MGLSLLTIVWDIDDVLNDFMRCWFEVYKYTHMPKCTLDYQDLTENPPHEILGLTLEEYHRSIDKFRLSQEFDQMQPNQQVHQWFIKYGNIYRHIALTAVPRHAVSKSAAWTLRHYGDWIRTFAFVPSERKGQDLPVYDLTKSDYLKWLNNSDILIEDNETNTVGLKSNTIRSLIINRPWNSSNTKVEHVLSILNEIRSSQGQCQITTKGN